MRADVIRNQPVDAVDADVNADNPNTDSTWSMIAIADELSNEPLDFLYIVDEAHRCLKMSMFSILLISMADELGVVGDPKNVCNFS